MQLRKLAFKIIHLTTILLLAWHSTLKDLKLPDRLMPHDVPTRWNSTFDMLEFVLVYQKVICSITGDPDLPGLEACELTTQEWRIVEQLSEILLVRS